MTMSNKNNLFENNENLYNFGDLRLLNKMKTANICIIEIGPKSRLSIPTNSSVQIKTDKYSKFE